MMDPITGMWVDNTTCTRCKHRHPPGWTCNYARTAAEIFAAARPAPEPGAEEDELNSPAIPHREISSAHKLNGDRTVAVSTEVFIDPDMTKCPRGVKVQLEGAGGCLLYGTYDGKDPFYVGWAPLPRRRPAC